MMRLAIVLILLFSGLLQAQAQPYPVIHSYRPRIYVDSTRFNWLRTNILVPGDCQTSYNEFNYRYINWWINDPQLYLTGSDSTLWTWNWNSQYAKDEAVFAIFMYKLNQDPLALKRCRFIARKVIDTLNTVNYSSMAFFDEEGFIRKFCDVSSLLIDWVYTDLPNAQLQQLVRAHYAMNREFMNTFILSASGTYYVASHNTWNCVFANQNALALYNAPGLTTLQNDTVNQWYDTVYNKWVNHFLPIYGYYRNDDGGWNWGGAYTMWSLVDQYQFFDNMLIGTGKDFYTELPWVKNSINQYWYMMQPNDWCIHLGDGQTFLGGDRAIYRHAALYGDPRSTWLAQRYSTPQYYFSTPFLFSKVLYKDFTIGPVTKPNLPTDWLSDKNGLSVSRSSWDTSATMVTFFNSPSKRSAHEHRDNNSFTVFKNKPLLLDAGYYDTYGGSHYYNYYSRTIAHNTVCVFDTAEDFFNWTAPASNDGGQIESFTLRDYPDIFLPQNQRGQWIKYAAGNGYQYNVADAQLSYDTAKLDFFRRRMLFVKPGRVIVLDHLHLLHTGTRQRDAKWIAHFDKQPAISGSMTGAAVPGNIMTYNGKDYTAVNGKGSVAVRTLLPANSSTTLIGGNGYQYWVDGVNYPPLTVPDSTKFTPGKWRIEVTPTTVTDSLVYLHTISTGDSINVAVAGGIAYNNVFSIGTDWTDTLFFFAADADTGKVYHRFDNVPGGRTVGIFAADLQAGSYLLKVDGATVATVATDTGGILQTSTPLAPGTHTVELVKPTTVVRDQTNSDESITVFPNPTRSELNIVTSTHAPVAIRIFGPGGNTLLHADRATAIDVSALPFGIYYVQVLQNGKVYTATFIKE
jgi:hypothetical protein